MAGLQMRKQLRMPLGLAVAESDLQMQVYLTLEPVISSIIAHCPHRNA